MNKIIEFFDYIYFSTKSKILKFKESRWCTKNKICCVCENFSYFMGSAGICEAKNGCPTNRMMDMMDSCNCNCFKKKEIKTWKIN